MNDTLILHHYDDSPWSGKIRLMVGLTGTHWCSLRAVLPESGNLA